MDQPTDRVVDAPIARFDDDGRLHIGWGEPSWFGPGTPIHAEGASPVLVDAVIETSDTLPVTVIELRTEAGGELPPGRFDVPNIGYAFRPQYRSPGDAPEGLTGLGYQYTEFALPVRCGADLCMWTLMPWRPPVVEPLLAVAPDGRTILLGPRDSFFDQIISVPTSESLERGIAFGWHGDLAEVPAGFTTRLAIVGGTGVADAIARYGELVTAGAPVRPDRDGDELGHRLSYWTDNGAAYWYRTEGGRDTTTTLTDTVDDLRARDIPIRSVQLDSWFYPHDVLRPFDTDDWVVPPTGLVEWEPRPDILPDGIGALRRALGDPPLVAHCRHLASSSPLVEQYPCWVDADRAHPADAALYEHWLDRCVDWGVETFEHDWLIECYLGVRSLREVPGRATAWQEGIDRAAEARGITLQWCMPSPADLLTAAHLGQVTSVRTSGDHGYMVGPGYLWNWFLVTNALARVLGLRPYKDVFWSDRSDPDHHSEAESLLAALSTGPVGLGDRLGGADRELVLRTCRADGVLVRPDVPLAAVERSLRRDATTEATALVGDAWTDHPAGRWRYVVALNAGESPDRHERLADRIEIADLGLLDDRGPAVLWDWRTGTARAIDPGDGWAVELDHLDWGLWVLAPIAACGIALVGDPTRYATAGDSLVAEVTDGADRIALELLGGEAVTLAGWAPVAPGSARVRAGDGAWRELPVSWDDPVWRIDVDPRGAPSVDVEVIT